MATMPRVWTTVLQESDQVGGFVWRLISGFGPIWGSRGMTMTGVLID